MTLEVFALKIKRRLNEFESEKLLKLIEEKRDKILKFKKLERVYQSILGYILIKFILIERYNINNKNIYLGNNDYGKPFLAEYPHLHFNISHSGDWVVCAFNTSEVGIDIEQIMPIDMAVLDVFCTKNEINQILSTEENERLKMIYTIWTSKESYVKAIGVGLNKDLKSFDVFQKDKINELQFLQIQLDDEYALTVCSKDTNVATIKKLDQYKLINKILNNKY